jgi:hypothetical protein
LNGHLATDLLKRNSNQVWQELLRNSKIFKTVEEMMKYALTHTLTHTLAHSRALSSHSIITHTHTHTHTVSHTHTHTHTHTPTQGRVLASFRN